VRLSWVGQVAFPGRIFSDAANYLYVVPVAGGFLAVPHPRLCIQNNKSHCVDSVSRLPFLEVTGVTKAPSEIGWSTAAFGRRRYPRFSSKLHYPHAATNS
jgi:hypothetical protein